jgi:molybdate transport system substrate-binding protein
MATILVAFILLFAQEAASQTRAVRVLASNGVKAVLEELLPQCERAIGSPLRIEFNTSATPKQRIETGEPFDVVILTREVVDELASQRKIARGSPKIIARSGIGIGIRTGAPKPDIRTPEALKQTLLKAKSITYAFDGASRVHIESMFERFRIAGDMKPKTVLHQGSIRAAASVAEGQTELVITLISEILPARGVELLGPVPAELQRYVSFAAGISATTDNTDGATRLIRFLTGPSVTSTFKAKGMETN